MSERLMPPGRFDYLKGNGQPLPQETSQEKMLRLLLVQHPAEKTQSIPVEACVPIQLKYLFENRKK